MSLSPKASEPSVQSNDFASLPDDIVRNIESILGDEAHVPDSYRYYHGLAYSVREQLIRNWMNTQRAYYDSMVKRVYYLSLEFLPGRFLMNCLTNMQIRKVCSEAVENLGLTMEELEEVEMDAGLGNGGLGRLASCYVDSMASLCIPGYGYGILYDYGIFFQSIVNGWQEESCDNWRRQGVPWEIPRREQLYEIRFYGRSEAYQDDQGRLRYRWVDTGNVMAMPCDILIPGYGGEHVTNMRLWTARSSSDFSLKHFNLGDYMRAMEDKVISENLTKVLYPNDELMQGKELRLKQQYFLVAATFQDIMRRYKKEHGALSAFADHVAVQLNDTHPSIAVAELMRLLLDEEGMSWEQAWSICTRTFAYTNHTVLPEALETWPVDLIGHVLPRHLEIIYEINHRFLQEVAERFSEDQGRLERMSIIQEGPVRRVRMANLAIVGSHTVNGVAALHSEIIKNGLFRDFDEFFPGKLTNVTNGVTPRRWLLQINPDLSELITSAIGPDWTCNLDLLRDLIPLADDSQFRQAFAAAKLANKKRLARYVLRRMGMGINPHTMFDCQFKRMHEYKRQLLNVLHIITRYNRLKSNPGVDHPARTILFGGKAAPGYFMAKLIIKLINSVAGLINNDPEVNRHLRVLFLPNYCISQAEKVVPAADLSEQISTAGYEASGTGNMKFSLNGALTIGTMDGANVEIMEEVGADNIFIFGLEEGQIEAERRQGYDPFSYYEKDQELKQTLDMIAAGRFSPDDPGLFMPIIDNLLRNGDYYLLLADYRPYVQAQERVDELYADKEQWMRKAILNTANMGKFSSDRAVMEYARKIWNVTPLTAEQLSG
ncbi:glycogen/starch/alpha-glucan phosphorylase [Desulfonatronospira sp.]|uniref:glycogen/starch/alpha-glucan phosphorylase n=1 Tax=Desulfonatronospira sp. TaxID=1962951 RepID=UPI0025BB3685|nr:glycogen/starch/alpha-glucan phosphorylase [Desulfonatronospira sp.]